MKTDVNQLKPLLFFFGCVGSLGIWGAQRQLLNLNAIHGIPRVITQEAAVMLYSNNVSSVVVMFQDSVYRLYSMGFL